MKIDKRALIVKQQRQSIYCLAGISAGQAANCRLGFKVLSK